MSHADLIAKQMQLAFDDSPWYGPSLHSLLDDIPRRRIHERPIPGGHSIAELLTHMAHWKEVALRRLDGDPVPEANASDWPVLDPKVATYAVLRKRVDTAYVRLTDRLAEFSDEDLRAPVAGNRLTRLQLLHGVLQHDVYHTGQLALLLKALQAR